MTRATALCLALLVLIAAIAVAGCSGGCATCGVIVPVRADITAAQLQIMLDEARPLQIVDVRTPVELDGGMILGAISIPLDQIKGPAEDLAALDRNVRTVVYCAAGVRSLTAAQALLDLGFTDVVNLLGGIDGWTGATHLPDCGCG